MDGGVVRAIRRVWVVAAGQWLEVVTASVADAGTWKPWLAPLDLNLDPAPSALGVDVDMNMAASPLDLGIDA
jgi:hypothetical protein